MFLVLGLQSWTRNSRWHWWGSPESRAKGQNHFPRPASPTGFDVGQDMVGHVGCKYTRRADIQFSIHRYPRFLLHRAALKPFIPRSVLILVVAVFTRAHSLSLSRSLWMSCLPSDTSMAIQLHVICELAEAILDPSVHDTLMKVLNGFGPSRDP